MPKTIDVYQIVTEAEFFFQCHCCLWSGLEEQICEEISYYLNLGVGILKRWRTRQMSYK